MKEDGQLIIVSGFIIAMSLVVLTIMLNSIIYTGNIAYEGTMGTHEKNMQDINWITKAEVDYAKDNYGSRANPNFDKYLDNCTKYVAALSAYKGASVSIDYKDTLDASGNGEVCMGYSDAALRSKYNLTIS